MRQVTAFDSFQVLLLKLATQFINLPVNQFDKHIENALKLIGEFVEADRCYIGTVSNDLQTATIVNEWSASPTRPISAEWGSALSAWFVEQLQRLEPVAIPDVEQMPADAAAYQTVLQQYGVKSCIDMPLLLDGRLYGFIGYESVTHQLDWSDETVALLEIVGEIYINALARRHAEQALIDKEKLQTALDKEKELYQLRSQLMANITHEFRTPLAIIQTSVHTMKYHYDDLEAEELIQHLERIDTHVENLATLFDDIIFAIRAEKGYLTFDPELIDLKQFCEDMIAALGHAMKRPDQQISFSSDSSFVAFRGDRTLLEHILTSIVSNAIKYSPDNGQIQVRLATSPSDITIIVGDNGVGIPDKDQERLFEPYFRATNVGTIQGTGLGLKIAKDCVELHGGTIAIESTEGIGTTFAINLPQM
jgi:signal transduction histidine kinase